MISKNVANTGEAKPILNSEYKKKKTPRSRTLQNFRRFHHCLRNSSNQPACIKVLHEKELFIWFDFRNVAPVNGTELASDARLRTINTPDVRKSSADTYNTAVVEQNKRILRGRRTFLNLLGKY